MNAIVAVDRNWGIGYEGCLLTNIPGDLRYFRRMTLGKVVVMGRATFDTLPGKKPLAGRTNIVLSRDPAFQPDCRVCRSYDELYAELGNYDPKDIFIIGGQSVYHLMLDCCERILVTKIDQDCIADCHFPDLDRRPEWELIACGDPVEEEGVVYRFTEYRRKWGQE